MTGFLLSNLGSPKSPHVKDVKEFLKEFLMDPYVIDLPWWLRTILVKGIILNIRPKKSSKLYQSIWLKESGSPIIYYSKKLIKQIRAMNPQIPINLGMRYGEMTLEKAILELIEKGVTKICLIPLYPHFALSSTETCINKVKSILLKLKKNIILTTVDSFYKEDGYIMALKDIIEPYLIKPYDHIIFSYHGIPIRHLSKSHGGNSHCYKSENCCELKNECQKYCYRYQVIQTTKAIVELLNIPIKNYTHAYQSRLSRKWLTPFTDEVVLNLSKKNVKKLIIVCPSFTADCLETIEEIGIRERKKWISYGGESLELVPSLNTNEKWIEFLNHTIQKNKNI